MVRRCTVSKNKGCSDDGSHTTPLLFITWLVLQHQLHQSVTFGSGNVSDGYMK
jgi:hypothetical protein